MALLEDYSGPFNPDVTIADFSRAFVCKLAYEYLLTGHLLDRCGQPLVGMEQGSAGFVRSGIEEWMGASPIYSKRMQRFMKYEGDDVGTVFKGLQLEVGSPQQFMDFQFRLDSPEYGEFWLAHCGALLDVERSSSTEAVKLMCHDIEDPTFDATAAATHPRMVMRPIHRPPRVDGEVLGVDGNGAGRWPHCRWAVYIGKENQPYEQHPNLEMVRKTRLAGIDIVVPEKDGEPGGWTDYSCAFDPHATLQDFSHRALVGIAQEFCVQTHLLMHSFILCNSQSMGEEKGHDLGKRMWTGHAMVGADRLQKRLGIVGDGISTIAKVIQLHPNFQPRTYTDIRVELTGENAARVELHDCPALQEETALTWFMQIDREVPSGLQAMVQHINPRARVTPADAGSAKYAWEIVVDPSNEPLPEPPEFNIARFTRGLNFQFEERRTLRP